MPEFVQPTIWNLSNTAAGLQVSYSVAGPNLHYHQGAVVKDFTGKEVRVAEVPDLGTLVSVTIHMTIDSGSTTFTVLLPRVNLPAPPALPAAVPVTTDGITVSVPAGGGIFGSICSVGCGVVEVAIGPSRLRWSWKTST